MHSFLNFYLYLRLNLRLGLGSIKPPIFTTLPSHGYYLYLYLCLYLEKKNRSPKLFFSDNDTDNKSWSGPLLLIWYELNDYVSDVDVWMCAFCYSFIFQIKVFKLFMFIIRFSFLGISRVWIDLEVIHTVSLKTTLPPN